MYCWTCKYYSPVDYIVDPDGIEQPYGVCNNDKAPEYGEEVPESYSCTEHELKEPQR